MCSTSSDGAKEEEESRSRKGRATPEDEKDAAALRHGNRGCYDGGDDDDEDGEVDAGATDGNGEFKANALGGPLCSHNHCDLGLAVGGEGGKCYRYLRIKDIGKI